MLPGLQLDTKRARIFYNTWYGRL